MADSFEVAEQALTVGWTPAPRASFQPGQPLTVAIDVSGESAAVLVAELNGQRDWVLDIVRCEFTDGHWTAISSGGGAYGDLPLEADPGSSAQIALACRSYSESDDQRQWAAGGFVTGNVQAVQLSVGALTRRVEIGPHPTAFVVFVCAGVDDEADEPDATLTLRAVDSAGLVVEDARDRHHPSSPDGSMSVAEALRQPAGTLVTVYGMLLALEGEPARLCDEIDSGARIPAPVGPALLLPTFDLELLPQVDSSAQVDTFMLTVTGTVSQGAILTLPEPQS